METQDHEENQELLEHLEMLVMLDQQEHLEHKEQRESWVHLAPQALLELVVSLALRDNKVKYKN